MMTSRQIDPQYFNDNMLTDEDFHYDIDDFLGVTYEEEQNLLKCFPDEFTLDKLINPSVEDVLNFNCSSINNTTFGDVLQPCLLTDKIVKQEQNEFETTNLSPHDQLPTVSISADTNYLLTDTPPHTPPGLLEGGSADSPPKHTPFSSIVVSFKPVPTMTYLVPPVANPPVVKSPKSQINIQPKPVEMVTEDVNVNFHSQTPVKLPTFKVKKPPSVIQEQLGRKDVPKKMFKNENGDAVMLKSQIRDVCEAALKRQERMIKNRESANLSRKRRQEHLAHLEGELIKVNAENANLKHENRQLKLRVSDLEKEVLRLKAAISIKAVKKTACLMVVFFMLTYNFSSYGNVFENVSTKPVEEAPESHHFGRVLLWSEENKTSELNVSRPSLHKRLLQVSSFVESWDPIYNFSTCQQFINKSESIRLENDLLGWVKRVEKKQKQSESSLKMQVLNSKIAIPPLPKLQQLGARFKNENNKDIWAKRKNRNEILIYQTLRKDYEDFFDAIHRREDSFYFISFSGDHLLLPAIAHNQTLRPRMSFVMPAMILNDSVEKSDDHVSMMQIDCEVMDTKLVYIKESVIPPHLRQKQNSTTKSSAKNVSQYAFRKNLPLHEQPLKLPLAKRRNR